RASYTRLKAEPVRTIDVLVGLNQRLAQEIGYLIRLEPGVQTPEQTLESKSGSCRDSAWLLCQVFRHLGLASRFVSGYIVQLKADQEALEGPSGASADFTDLHAWCEVFIPGAGWIGLDATSGLLAGEGHIPLACTPDPTSAAPITGVLSEAKTDFHFDMTVTRIFESPRVAKPYTPQQWEAMDALGQRIDQDMTELDMRLTVGGEPTFISIDDPDGPEWNVTAQGPKKRLLSGELLKRLQGQFSFGGFLHYGQGKWYPGEPLPRYALGCFWRTDGQAIWENPALVADEEKDYGHGIAEARRFADKLMETLHVDPQWLLPAHEDVEYYEWKKRRLPSNVDAKNSQLPLKEEGERLARLTEEKLAEVVGWVLPIHHVEKRWRSAPWYLRDNKLWLIQGDSPVGYRLPLASLPWVKPEDYPYLHTPDLSAPREPLPPRAHELEPLPEAEEIPPVAPPPAPQESADRIARTALIVEPRHGRVHIFMPPVEDLVAYLDLVAAIEHTAAALEMPVIVEGEPPPRDPRIEVIKVTPDPGVIEVNLHPTKSWDQLVHQTKTLYDEARQMRLGTEKFMVDGRHTGTGGGNHIVLGAATPLDSPLLRRPDLLRSLVSYWHNHPALSYLFTGLFIGPTSQAPRVDEARNDALYELELAFQQIPRKGEVAPWLVDRLFRNLLIDVTGNTHRTEFCIDKLYAPESSTGRLGLLELRSFEMPPHPEMALAQHVLLRALLAAFWRDPYEAPLERWGQRLHDRFMLPHFIWDDLQDVLIDLKERGYALEPAWFAPHFEFRFPKIGHIVQRGLQLELRSALEPWHVLGEEPAGGATVRFVDSSVERMQVKVSGLVESRHLITCNGRRVPLHPTGVAGEFVAAVRYRAWQPPECLHPTIKVHAPLVFDIFDSWNQRSIGGCTYHVSHPGGISYDTFPVNAYTAEARRLARFSPLGHTPGTAAAVPPVECNRDFPMTLDLRVAR
ncbi:MAG TPA: transglutaminase family protein, partial [Chthoniobacteraceae bacterium]|nr:transglutaminase family protein [Chthoniobacteraceae bacterium]